MKPQCKDCKWVEATESSYDDIKIIKGGRNHTLFLSSPSHLS